MVDKTIFRELAAELAGELYTDKLRRTLLATDAGIYQVEPAAVVYPRNAVDVQHTLRFASKQQLSVHPRGAGSGLCGSSLGRGIVLDFSRFMHSLISFEPDKQCFSCEPGYKYGELEALLKGSGLFFPPAPSSGEYASFGGMYATNAGGGYSAKYGNVADYILDADIVLADGTITSLSEIADTTPDMLPPNLEELYRIIDRNKKQIEKAYPDVPCNVCGYELRGLTDSGSLLLHKLLGGSEGTLAVVTSLKFRLAEKPHYSAMIVAYFNDITSSAKAALLAQKYAPSSMEIMDKSLLRVAMEHDPSLKENIPQGYDNVVMIEFEAFTEYELEGLVDRCMKELVKKKLAEHVSSVLTEEEMAQFWAVRKAAMPTLYLLKSRRKVIPLVEDAAVPSRELVSYFKGLYEIFTKYKVEFALYGHIAKGLIHSRPLLDLKDQADIDLLNPIADDVFRLVRSLGGTISGEHGDGRLRSLYIPQQYGDVAEFFLKVKELLDPERRLNPKIKTYFDPHQLTRSMRYGYEYRSEEPDNKVLIWEEGMTQDVELCHGCSKCTTVTTATRMCPMYKNSRDEISTPKAKANILRALISGKVSRQELFEQSFQAVMKRCVNCGSCTRECPSHVNIPKMAVEAKSQYIRQFGADFENRILTHFETIGRYTRKIAPIANPLMKLKAMRKLAEKVSGISSKREFVRFARKSLFDRFQEYTGEASKKALYFAGCYASYARPEIGESTIRILNRLGYQVLLPEQHCCGIPHYSKGLSDGSREKIEENINSWGRLLDEVDVLVVSCSSCALALLQGWNYYLGGEIMQKIKDSTVHISALVSKHLPELALKADNLGVAYHAPCHMKLLPEPNASWKLLNATDGINATALADSCCGMAGSWGLTKEHYEESLKIAFPMIQSLSASNCTICATDCPSCEMQLSHLTKKLVLHPVEIIDKIMG